MHVCFFENSFFNSISYLVEVENKLILIDPSNEEQFLELIEKSIHEPSYIFLTHEHIDHIQGIVYLKDKYKHVKIVATEHTSKSIVDPKKNLSLFHGFEFVGIEADILINNNYELEIDKTKINLIPCKGHSLGGMFININNAIFTGDEFIYELKTVTKLPGGNINEVSNSFDFLNSNFDGNTILYPGHGKKFILEALKIW
jgi:hydroxyacylglutathione hydrolase